MTNEFTTYCNRYYKLTRLHAMREERLKNLLDNAPLYCGQSSISDIDAIISYYRKVQAYKAKTEKTLDNLKKTERTILMIMRHFEIPPGTVLYGEIPGELEYEIWADENDALYISKTNDLAPKQLNPNIITIKFSNWIDGEGED
ncbi:MAG: hypothetical protein ACHQIM_10045 [Sphingobacteriales bacterium]